MAEIGDGEAINRMSDELVLDALAMAASQRKPGHVIHRSDQGSP
ncbi:hypothetical protein [Methylobacterium sp. 4-46]